jgi:RNase P subunit RPR2
MIDPKKCCHFINHLTVRTRGARKYENDRSPPPRVEVECAACGWTGWYRREK